MKDFFEKLKINIPVRLQHPCFWIGIIGTILSALNVRIEDLTTWQAVGEMIQNLFSSPAQISFVVMALIGVFTDQTTKGVGDSKQALGYKEPKNKE